MPSPQNRHCRRGKCIVKEVTTLSLTVDVGGCGGRKNDDTPPPSAFPIPASGSDIGGNVGGSGNIGGSGNVGGSSSNNNIGTNGTNTNKSIDPQAQEDVLRV